MNLRIFFVLPVALMLAATTFAQKPFYKPQVHEISLQLGELHQLPGINAGFNDRTPVSGTFLNGGWYKYHLTLNHAFRAGFTYRNTNINLIEGRDQFMTYTAKRRDFDAMMGYQWTAPLGRGAFYAGIDAMLTRSDIQETGIEDLLSSFIYQIDYTQMRLGGKGFVGLKYYVSPFVSLGLEAGPYFQRALTTPSTDRPYSIFEDDEFGIRAAATVSFHFKQMKKRCTCPRH